MDNIIDDHVKTATHRIFPAGINHPLGHLELIIQGSNTSSILGCYWDSTDFASETIKDSIERSRGDVVAGDSDLTKTINDLAVSLHIDTGIYHSLGSHKESSSKHTSSNTHSIVDPVTAIRCRISDSSSTTNDTLNPRNGLIV